MRVLLPLHGFLAWNGGVDLIRLISLALSRAAGTADLQVKYAVPIPSAGRRLAGGLLRRWRVMRINGKSEGGSPALAQVALEFLSEGDLIYCSATARGILRSASEFAADVIFPTMVPLKQVRPATVGYIFDFQHRYMPHLFPARTRRNRDRRFQALARGTDGIVVNCRAAASDVQRFLGVSPERILAMPFAPYVQPWRLGVDPLSVRSRYGIRGRYLLVCNHFWMHKDHATALQAFALLHRDPKNADLRLVMTGDPVDHRNPRHYVQLQLLCKTLGIERMVHFLGLIPKHDQVALMRGCVVLWQPTLFEGGPGGGAVYEAVGLGVPAVVSDIATNREIDRGHVRFFRAGDAAHLAAQTGEWLAAPPERPPAETLLADSDANLVRLGGAILQFLDRIRLHG